ncbi:aryl-alcohol-oxidase from pleurotus Eryingii [Mycena sp. CBHHK59/15]|nr:aryl-alcohol-oxidase from pleurotus Eryingii [Mycena sp. CBHHK59/15]
MVRLWTFFILGSSVCSGVILDNVSELKKLNLNFDFIVVGGGAAGNVIANRLSENTEFSVLILEAGGSNEDMTDLIVPAYLGLNGRSVPYPRGFVLGGSSSVNYMLYTRGTKEDYDRYARVTGDEGWSWDNLTPYMRKNERFGAPVDHHNTTGQFDPTVHGYRGVNTVTLAGFPTAISQRVIQTTDELSDEFPFVLDMNSGDHIGVGWPQSTVKDGARSSSATSYLAPKYVNRPNLHVVLNTRVTRVLKIHTQTAFRTVELYQDIKGTPLTITAKKEVILSAGAIGTPTILLHSGIGNSTTISSLGITPLHDLPSVGQNMSDHPLLGMGWAVNSTDTTETAVRNATLAAEEFAQWNRSRTGPLVNTPMTHVAWLRIPDNSTIFEGQPDPAAGPNTAHYEFIISNGVIGTPPPTGNYIGISPVLVAPTARGSVTLNSSNLFVAPLINPNLLGTELDLAMMREAVKSAIRFAAAPAWSGYVLGGEVDSSTTDAELDKFIIGSTQTLYHPVGTAMMSPKGASYGVVDPDLKVKGLKGLRVVDVSVLPFVPAAHTQATAYIFAERAADLIKGDWC